MARIKDDTGGRGGSSADYGASASSGQRGGFDSEQNPSGPAGQEVLSSQLPGNPHSSRGFRRALMRADRQPSTLKDMVKGSDFSGKGFGKPNYFAQGGRRRGLHIGAGAPATTPATDQSGESFGE